MSAQKKLQEEDRSNEIIKIRDMLSMGDTTVQMGNEMRAIPREKREILMKEAHWRFYRNKD